MKCQRSILGIRRHDFVRNSEVSLRTGLAPVSDRITRGRNAIFGHVARMPAHQAMLCQVKLSVGRPQTLHGNVHQVDHIPNGPTNSAVTTTIFQLRLCGGKPSVAVTRERRYGPSRLRINDDDNDDFACRPSSMSVVWVFNVMCWCFFVLILGLLRFHYFHFLFDSDRFSHKNLGFGFVSVLRYLLAKNLFWAISSSALLNNPVSVSTLHTITCVCSLSVKTVGNPLL